MNSRPKGWANPWTDEGEELGEIPVELSDAWNIACHNAFEAGASAIIPYVQEATLKEIGEWLQFGRAWVGGIPIVSKSEVEALLRGEMPK